MDYENLMTAEDLIQRYEALAGAGQCRKTTLAELVKESILAVVVVVMAVTRAMD